MIIIGLTVCKQPSLKRHDRAPNCFSAAAQQQQHNQRQPTKTTPEVHLSLQPLVEMVEGQDGLGAGGELRTGLPVSRRDRQRVVVVVVGQADAGAASRSFVMMR